MQKMTCVFRNFRLLFTIDVWVIREKSLFFKKIIVSFNNLHLTFLFTTLLLLSIALVFKNFSKHKYIVRKSGDYKKTNLCKLNLI